MFLCNSMLEQGIGNVKKVSIEYYNLLSFVHPKKKNPM